MPIHGNYTPNKIKIIPTLFVRHYLFKRPFRSSAGPAGRRVDSPELPVVPTPSVHNKPPIKLKGLIELFLFGVSK